MDRRGGKLRARLNPRRLWHSIVWKALAPVLREHPAWPAALDGSNTYTTDGEGGVKPSDQDFVEYLRAIHIFPIVAACINRISQCAADVPLTVHSLSDGEELPEHPLVELFRRPNPTPQGGATHFFQKSYQQILLTGELNWAVDRTMANPGALWLLESARLDPIPSRSNAWPYLGFVYDGSRFRIRVDADRVLRVLRPHPDDPLRGLSYIKQLEWTLATFFELNRFNHTMLKHGARLGGILRVKGIFGEKERSALERRIEERYTGSKKAGKILVLSAEEAQFQKDNESPKDMEGQALYDNLKKEVLNVFGCPPGLFDSKDVNRSNMREQRALLYTDAVRPLVNLVIDEINGSPMTPDVEVRAKWDSIEALQPNVLELAQRDEIYVRAGIETRKSVV